MNYTSILFSRSDTVATITLNRPEVRNAFNGEMMAEITKALEEADNDPKIKVVILTGDNRTFAAGVDISQMRDKEFPDTYTRDFITNGWEAVSNFRKPIIAAIEGYALGGGCETAMMCDIIVAARTAKLGQPEVNLGIIPGIGGTQRLTKLVGRAKAMDMCLTGKMITAVEAESMGLVSRLCDDGQALNVAKEIANVIASKSLPSLLMAKEAVKAAEELPLTEGIKLERRLFQSLFATYDQKEGMTAFLEKRSPVFKDE